MKNNRRIERNPERGAAAVEFALVFPILAALLFGVVDFGWYFHQRTCLSIAVRDGVRQGITVSQSATTGPDATAIQVAKAEMQSTGGISPSNVILTATYGGSSPTKTLTLKATGTYQDLTGFFKFKLALDASVTMMLEDQ